MFSLKTEHEKFQNFDANEQWNSRLDALYLAYVFQIYCIVKNNNNIMLCCWTRTLSELEFLKSLWGLGTEEE